MSHSFSTLQSLSREAQLYSLFNSEDFIALNPEPRLSQWPALTLILSEYLLCCLGHNQTE